VNEKLVFVRKYANQAEPVQNRTPYGSFPAAGNGNAAACGGLTLATAVKGVVPPNPEEVVMFPRSLHVLPAIRY
jgi:hypothetical protein